MFTDLMKLPDEKRFYPYQMGFPFELTYTVSANAPDNNFKTIVLRGNQTISTDNFLLENKITTEQSSFKTVSKMRLKTKEIPIKDYDAFRRDIRRAIDDSKWTVLFTRDEHATTKKSLEKKAANDLNDIKALLELAKHHLAVAEFDEALKVANSAIKLDPNNGEAHYSAGIALGFLEKYSESQEAITKSRNLGYRP
jgi:tetratricopeptide (TPR) repeat protein